MQQILLRHIHDTPSYSHVPVRNPMLGLPSRPCQRVLPTPPCLQPPLPSSEHASDLVALSSCSILFSSSCCCLLLVFSGVGCSFLVAAERVDHARLSLQRTPGMARRIYYAGRPKMRVWSETKFAPKKERILPGWFFNTDKPQQRKDTVCLVVWLWLVVAPCKLRAEDLVA